MRITILLLDLNPTFNNCISTFGPACIQAKKSLAAAPTVELETEACF